MKSIQISIDSVSKHYPIHIANALADLSKPFQAFSRYKKITIITNDKVAPLHLESLLQSINQNLNIKASNFLLPDGESYKNTASLELIIDHLVDQKLSRSDLIVAFGGGVIGDITGLAASLYRRGVDFVQIPTSLLAMVDSSVGGKTAVNHPLGKNLIGTFNQPVAVLTNVDYLKTLPRTEFSAGLAEIVKAAVIQDPAFFEWLEHNNEQLMRLDASSVTDAIVKSCSIKADIVAQDEKEQGIRAHLNLGHTFGHAIEAVLGFGSILHGEAVAIGMVLASKFVSFQQNHTDQSDLTKRLQKLLKAFKLPTCLPAELKNKASIERLVEAMSHDKKNIDASVRLILPTGLGRVKLESVAPSELQMFLQQL